MAEGQVQDPGALDEVLAWNGAVHVFPREGFTERSHLKYLWISPAAINITTALLISLYIIMKDNSGPLRPSIERVEISVMRIFRPIALTVYLKHMEFLVYLDGNVDYLVYLLDGVLPPPVKDLCGEAFDATKSTVDDVQKYGIYGTAKAHYDKYEPVVKFHGIQACKKALSLPMAPEAAAVSLYTAEQVNNFIISVKETRLPLVSFLPLLPVNYLDNILRNE